MSENKDGSLRSRIFKSFFIALLPVLGFSLLTVEIFLIPSIKNSVKQELENSTRVLRNAVEAAASITIRNHLQAIAERNLDIIRNHFLLVEQGLITRKEAINRLTYILLSQKVGSSGYIYCLDSQGVVVVHPNELLLGTNVSDFAFVRKQVESKRGYLEYDWKNPGEEVARPKALYMAYFEPLDWIISASSYRSEFNELLNPSDFRDAVLSLKFGKTGYAYVMNRKGEILIHPKYDRFNLFEQTDLSADFAHEMLNNESGSIEYEWRNPDERSVRQKIAVYQNIPEYGWTIVSSSYTAEVYQPVNVARLITYVTILLLLVAASLTSYLLSGRVTRPVEIMMHRLDKNASHGVHEQLPILGNDELGRLAVIFNHYLQKLEVQKDELRIQQERYRDLFEASPDAIFLLRGLTIINCNPATFELFKGDEESVLGNTVTSLSPELQEDGNSSSSKALEMVKVAIDHGFHTFEWLHQTVAGDVFYTEVRLKPYREEGKEETFLLAFAINITEKKKALDALQESELKYRQLIESANDAIFIVQDGKMRFANNRTASIVGCKKNDLLDKPFQMFIHPDDRDMVVERHIKRLQGDTAIPPTYSFRLIDTGNGERTVQLNTVLIDWRNKPATLNFVRDITEQKKMEEVFHHAQKMEAIGTLAGGIAHDFNNLLMGIQGRASLMRLSISGEDTNHEHLIAIDEYVESASALTQQLLGAARGGKYNPKPYDLNEIIEKSARMFGRTKKEISINLQLNLTPIIAEVEKQQIEQVLLNMYVNGWQAMPDGGSLHIGSSVETSSRNQSTIKTQADKGDYAVITIADTGTGMDNTTLQRIFDPFFTTKDKERGTGLGLASAYGIIKNHGGFINVESKVGHGTTFSICIPLSEETPVPEPVKSLSITKGTETILLVDDEDIILEVGEAILAEMGYKVLKAKGGKEAVNILESGDFHIDLMILDMIMPEMDGTKTFKEVKRLCPELPVILSSGYSMNEPAETIMKMGCKGFIQKPFNMLELSQLLRTVLL